MKFTLVSLILLLSYSLQAQNDWRVYENDSQELDEVALIESDSNSFVYKEGHVEVYSDPRIDSLVSHLDKHPVEIKGYRVEIFFGKRKDAENIKSQF